MTKLRTDQQIYLDGHRAGALAMFRHVRNTLAQATVGRLVLGPVEILRMLDSSHEQTAAEAVTSHLEEKFRYARTFDEDPIAEGPPPHEGAGEG